MRIFVLLLFFIGATFSFTSIKAQPPWLSPKYFKLHSPGDSNKLHNFYEIQKAFKAYVKDILKRPAEYDLTTEEENKAHIPGYKLYKRWEWLMAPRVYPSGDIGLPSFNNGKFLLQQSFAGYKNKTLLQDPQFAGGNWRLSSPRPVPLSSPVNANGIGRVNCIKFDPNNSNIIWVGSPSGGLWKSVNGGQSWVTPTDQLAVIGCSDIAIDPINTNIMYLATGDADGYDTYSIGVLKSEDGGITWNTTGFSIPTASYILIHEMLIDPLHPETVFAATTAGVFKTDDGGSNWSMVLSGDINDIAFKPSDPSILYAVSQYSGTAKLYQSSNSGQTFAELSNGLPVSGISRFAIGVSLASPNTIYLLAVNTAGYAGLYRSADSGVSFSLQSASPDIIGGQWYYDLAIVVNPFNSNDIYVGGINQYRSVNGGTTWSLISNTHVDIHALEFLPGSSTTLFTGNDGGIGKSSNNGTTFTNLSNGLEISQIYRIGVSPLINTLTLTGLQDNGTYKLNAGRWSSFSTGDGMECIADHSDSNIMYSTYQYGNLNKSIDGGASLIPIVTSNGTGVNSAGNFLTPVVMHPTDHNTLLLGKDQVYRSVDGGHQWMQMGVLPTTIKVESIHYAPSDADYIYVTNYNAVYVTTNGNNFVNRTAGLPVAEAAITNLAVSDQDPQKIWVTFSGYAAGKKVYYSNNAGITWVNYSAGLPNLPVNCITYQNFTNDGLYAGTDIGVYFKSNSLAEWKPFFNGLPNVIVDELEIQYNAGKIRAATYGRGLWESDLAIPHASFTANPDKICAGGSVHFTAHAASDQIDSLSWSFPGGTPATSTAFNPVITYNAADSFNVSVTLTNSNGYSTKTYVNAVRTYTQLQPGSIAVSSRLVCAGDSVTLSLSGSTGNIQWQSSSDRINFNNIIGQTTAACKVALVSNTFFRAMLYGGSCSSLYTITDSVKVNPSPAATVTANGPLQFCEGNVVLQCAAAASYEWSTGETTSSVTVNASGTYHVKATNAFGCSKLSMPVTVVSNMGTLIRKADIPAGRYFAFSFSIGDKLYVGGGQSNPTTYLNDLWEYDPAVNGWTQKNAFPGSYPSAASGFSIGDKGYVTGGRNASLVSSRDLWEYNPQSDNWIRRADFSGAARSLAVAFTIGNKAYLGTGTSNNVTSVYFNDLWEYDQVLNTWTQKANFPGTARFSAIGFTIYNKGYIGTGFDLNNQFKNDFWEYDPVNNTWLQKTNYGGTSRSSAKGFAVNNKGYVVGGRDAGGAKKDTWEYDGQLNNWKQRAAYASTRNQLVALAAADKAYIGTGSDAGNAGQRDWWEFTPSENFSLGSDTTAYIDCPGNNANLYSVFDTAGITTSWNTAAPAQAVAGNYLLYATNAAGCKDTAGVTVILEIATWTGSISNNWHMAANWNTGKVPSSNTHVIIPAGTNNTCKIFISNAEAASVQVINNATLEIVPGFDLLVAQKCFVLPGH